MSGGSWDYLYQRVADAAYRLQAERDPLRRAFGVHLEAVSTALHDIEWVDSYDYGKGDEADAIRKVVTPAQELAAARSLLMDALDAANATLKRIDEVTP